MRWVLASIGLLVVIVVFSLAALDQKNVVWESGTPNCPHCRTEVQAYSSVCATCGRAFDWETWESDCTACLSDLDGRFYRKLLEDRGEEFQALVSRSSWSDETKADLETYALGLRRGTCLFCGGTGRWLVLEPVEKVADNGGRSARTKELVKLLDGRCPVCFDSGRCPLCDGDHRVVNAREGAARDLATLEARLRSLPRDRADAVEMTFKAIQGYFRSHAGRAEIALAPSFDGVPPLSRAQIRWLAVKRILDQLSAGD